MCRICFFCCLVSSACVTSLMPTVMACYYMKLWSPMIPTDTYSRQNEIDLFSKLITCNEQFSNSYSHSFYYTPTRSKIYNINIGSEFNKVEQDKVDLICCCLCCKNGMPICF
jgi:hypothetical protein